MDGLAKHYHYDSFEDMYLCKYCRFTWLPNEIGLAENMQAGWRKLSA